MRILNVAFLVDDIIASYTFREHSQSIQFWKNTSDRRPLQALYYRNVLGSGYDTSPRLRFVFRPLTAKFRNENGAIIFTATPLKHSK